MIKVIKTEVNQRIEIDLPEGYIYDESKKLDINEFIEKLLIPIKRIHVADPSEDKS